MASLHRLHVRDERDRYPELLEYQHGHCALCSSTPKTRRFAIDHDHRTMTTRGLLCHRCNRALPAWVTAGWLRRAADYLESPPAVALLSANEEKVS